MSYFPCDIPFMSEDEKKKNGIKCNSDVDKDTNVCSNDTISRQDAIDKLRRRKALFCENQIEFKLLPINDKSRVDEIDACIAMLINMPSEQPKRDIPIKPNETTDKAWGIPKRQAVCPKCDYYLGHVAFLGDYKGKRITYCEVCGQAIDWEGWKFDE